MPSRTRTLNSRTVLEQDRELEALGAARPLWAPRRVWLMMRSGVRLTGVGCMLRLGCPKTDGSAMR